jgi:ubiquinone/menaquinone biosynthesis C-methylase UbiE
MDVFLHLALADYFHRGTEMLPTWKIMDLGCGVGRQTLHLAKKAKFVVGTDISKSLLRMAIRYKHLKKLRSSPQFKVVNGRDLRGFDNDSFDCVFSYDMLKFLRFEQHILDYTRDIFRIIRKGGYAQLHIPTRGISIDSPDPRIGANLQPGSWEKLLDELQPAKADIILKVNSEEECEWVLIQK